MISRLIAPLLTQRATVYSENATTGAFTTVAESDLACFIRLRELNQPVAEGRAEIAAYRTLYFDPDYDLDEQAQLEIDGVRYNQVAGSQYAPVVAFAADPLYRQVTIVRVA